MIREFPYTNLHDLNIDWILKIVKDFQERYQNLDETFQNMLQQIETAGNNAIEDINNHEETALESIRLFLEQCIQALSNETNGQINEISNFAHNQLDSISQAGVAQVNIVNGLITSLPQTYEDCVNQLQIINAVLNQTYNYPPLVQGHYNDANESDSKTLVADNYKVSTLLSSGCASRKLKIQITGASGIIREIIYWTGWDSNAVAHSVPVSTSTSDEKIIYEYTFPATATYFTIVFCSDYDMLTQFLVSDLQVSFEWKFTDLDSINDLKSAFFSDYVGTPKKTLQIRELVQGSYDTNGEPTSGSTTRIRLNDKIRVFVGDIVSFTGGSNARRCLYAKYNESGTYIDSVSERIVFTDTITFNGFILPVFKRESGNSDNLLTSQYDASFSIEREYNHVGNDANKAEQLSLMRKKFVSSDFTQGGIGTSGYETTGTIRIRTNRFQVNSGDILLFSPGTVTDTLIYALYDNGGNYVDIYTNLTGDSYVIMPYNGYITVVLKSSSITDISPTDYDADVQIISNTKAESLSETKINFEYGGLSINDGYVFAASTYSSSRSKYTYKSNAGEIVSVKYNAYDISGGKLRVFFYANDTTFIKYTDYTPQNNTIMFIVPADAVYMRFVIVRNDDYYNMHNAVVGCSGDFTKCYNLNQPRMSTYGGIGFNYTVSGKTMTSGRLRLPPNYTPDGSQKIPLIVYGHGSGGMTTWNSVLGGAGETPGEHTVEFGYLCDEGFAVFDCYPWTNKEDLSALTGGVYNPVSIPVNMLSYIEGIKYVCDRYNVDIDNVCLLVKSQGGNLGHWAMNQDYFKFKAIGLFAPSVGICNLKLGHIYFNKNERTAITKYVHFEGTSTQINTFINTANGKDSSAVMTFLRNNIDKVISTIPFAHGLRGAKYDDIFDGAFTGLDATPQWMLDKGVPAYNPAESMMPAIASHDEYSRYTATPCKYWLAYDDENTSSHMAYAIYTWLLNGGSDVQFRVLPNGTGKHYAMDSSPDALRESGTTRLGLPYTDVALGYIEAVDFFYEKMALL